MLSTYFLSANDLFPLCPIVYGIVYGKELGDRLI